MILVTFCLLFQAFKQLFCDAYSPRKVIIKLLVKIDGKIDHVKS